VNTTNNYFVNGDTITSKTTRPNKNLECNVIVNNLAGSVETNTTIEQNENSVSLTRNAQALKFNNCGVEQVQSHLNHLLDSTSSLRPKRKKPTEDLAA
jgi:hypothetical protein